MKMSHVSLGLLCLGLATGLQLAFAQPRAAFADLPVTRVVLFTSGVAYFEHSGTVEGDSRQELTVEEEHMDDLLQSLVLQDYGGGEIRPVRYDSSDPLHRILGSYSLDLSGDPTLAQLLSQARGEEVRLVAGSKMTGSIVNLERVDHPEEAPTTYLTLATDTGLHRVALEEVSEISFTDEDVQEELTQALGAIAANRSDGQKSVELFFSGSGERRVSVGYVREMPVWKTSYRLVLAEEGQAQLQGWAIFDNPTDMDLEDVEVTFVAGQPLSFITRLFEPTYVERPSVEVETAPALVAPTYAESTMQSMQRSFMDMAEREMALPPSGAAPVPNLGGAGVNAMSQGVRTGSTFSYQVQEPVTVSRFESAMIPIIQTTLPAQRSSVFDPSVLSGSPLRAVRIQNDSGLHLAAGPVTIFDEGGYAGTARTGDLPPGANGLLTHAVDLELAVETVSSSEPEEVVSARFRQGALQTEVRMRIRTEYLIEPQGEVDRHLLVVHPARSDYELVSPEGVQRTDGTYRIGVAIGDAGSAARSGPPAAPEVGNEDALPRHVQCEPGAPCRLETVMDRVVTRTVSLTDITPDAIAFYLENVQLSDEAEALLEEVLAVKEQLVGAERRIADLEARVNAIHADQSRVRQNMEALDRNSSLYRRYLTQLEEQEDELSEIRENLEEATSERRELQERLGQLLASFAE